MLPYSQMAVLVKLHLFAFLACLSFQAYKPQSYSRKLSPRKDLVHGMVLRAPASESRTLLGKDRLLAVWEVNDRDFLAP